MKLRTCAAIAVLGAASAFSLPSAHAQTMKPADPADTTATSPATMYRSAFEGYQRHDETPVGSWRAANDEAASLGGHVGQIRGEARGAGMSGMPMQSGGSSPSTGHAHHHGMKEKR